MDINLGTIGMKHTSKELIEQVSKLKEPIEGLLYFEGNNLAVIFKAWRCSDEEYYISLTGNGVFVYESLEELADVICSGRNIVILKFIHMNDVKIKGVIGGTISG
jgi:hypothetical protein